jgi:hypothetical protein
LNDVDVGSSAPLHHELTRRADGGQHYEIGRVNTSASLVSGCSKLRAWAWSTALNRSGTCSLPVQVLEVLVHGAPGHAKGVSDASGRVPLSQ